MLHQRKKLLKMLLMASIAMNTGSMLQAQPASLNANKIVQPYYKCWGLLTEGCPNAEKLGWKVGVQYHTFNKHTVFEAIELTRALGLHYIELNLEAKICAESDETIGVGMSQEIKDKLKKKLAENGVRCETAYCWMDGSGNGFEDLVKLCKEMGWMIVTDPIRTDRGGKPVDFYEEILNKYGVKMVFTNHPKKAAYWNPDFTVEDTKDRGENIGASIDVGHYMRDGFDAYEICKRYIEIGKLRHFHMRDVTLLEKRGLDVPLGTGKGRIPEIFRTLNDNQVKPVMILEYEHDFDNPMPYLIKSVNYINDFCATLLQENNEKARLGEPIRLYASEAQLSEGLNLVDEGEAATIHNWNKPQQPITWTADLKPGNYQVWMNYTQPNGGSALSVQADGQELATLVRPTVTWYDYTRANLGVLHIANGGKVTIQMNGMQHAVLRNKAGKLVVGGALPDIHYLELVPTSLPATSGMVGINSEFSGTPLFNGKDLTGWEGNEGEVTLQNFRVEKKAIVAGKFGKALDKNQFLRTERTYKNFELRLKYKVKPIDEDYNGGIQIRSIKNENPRTPHEMYGYQVDILSWKHGGLYDEERRRDFLGFQMANAPEKYNPEKWNEYIIRCEGPRIRVWLNGVKTTDYIEPYTLNPLEGIGTIGQEGYIALQIHSGKGSEVWYKDIEIQELPE